MSSEGKHDKPNSLIQEMKLEFGFAWRDPVKVTPVQKWKALSLLESAATLLPEPAQKKFVERGLRKLDEEIESKYRSKSYDYYEIIVDAISQHVEEYSKGTV